MQMAGALRLFYSTPAEREEMALLADEGRDERKEVDSDDGGGGLRRKRGRR